MAAFSNSHRRWMAAVAGLALLHAPLVSCATRGSSFDIDKIPRIEKGVTTRQQVDGWFGTPVSMTKRPSGFTIYRYLHEEESVRDSGFFSRIAAFVAGFFGYQGRGAPVNVRYENTVRHELLLLFDPEGIVSSYGYERTEIPSKRVY